MSSANDTAPLELDVRGLVCPEPVLRTRKALETAGNRPVVVITDSPESRDNIVRFAQKAGYTVSASEREPGIYSISIRKLVVSKPGTQPEATNNSVISPSGPVLLLGSDELGRGNEELGRLLMTLFLRTLTELPTKPSSILLANNGVKLALEGSEPLASLKTLEQQGVVIRVCGTCLDFFGVKDRVRVGTVSNMYELAETLLTGDRVTIL
ncbi:MAG: sulfurtransferase-like selenium metabolism protein YedF [candidate division WOR-3 bacterium]